MALRESFPLILTSFVNKCGQIGLTLLPILIIEKGISVSEGSLILGAVKASAFIGTFFGGWSSDNWGLKRTMLVSFVACGIGLGLLPLMPTVLGMLICGVVAQMGHAMYPSAARMMLTEMLPQSRLKEGVGWLRTANNGGQIVSYGFGTLFAGLGTAAFYYLDSITSFVAAAIGFFLLSPHVAQNKKHEVAEIDSVSVLQLLHPKSLKNQSIRLFLHCALLIGLYALIYEVLMIGVAAKTKLIFGDEGLKIFSQYMIVNVILCTLFAVPAARFFKNARKTFVWGFLILGVGGAISLHASPGRLDLFAGSFLMTFGEIIFSSMSQYTMLSLIPASRQKGSLYSLSVIIQKVGVVVAGLITLPLVVNGGLASIAIGVLTVSSLLLTWLFPFRHLK